MGVKNTVGLHVVGHTPILPPPLRPRSEMQSRPVLELADESSAPISSMLLVSLCAAWHDIGDRAKDVLGTIQPQPKVKPV